MVDGGLADPASPRSAVRRQAAAPAVHVLGRVDGLVGNVGEVVHHRERRLVDRAEVLDGVDNNGAGRMSPLEDEAACDNRLRDVVAAEERGSDRAAGNDDGEGRGKEQNAAAGPAPARRRKVGCRRALEDVSEPDELGRKLSHGVSLEFESRMRSAARPRCTRTRAAVGVVSSRSAMPS